MRRIRLLLLLSLSLFQPLVGCFTTQQQVKRTPPPPEEDLSGLTPLQLSIRQCEKGIAKICQQLGKKYELGIELKRDMDAALGYYRRACEQKDPLGCFYLGRFLSYNLHNDPLFSVKELQQAQTYFTRSCDEGFARACLRHARYLRESIFYTGNRRLAGAYYKKAQEAAISACEQKDRHGCYALAWLYEHGVIYKNQKRTSISYYKLSCDKGLGLACYRLGRVIQGDWNMVTDLDRALALYGRACQLNNAAGCYAQAQVALRVPEIRKKNYHVPKLQRACHFYHGPSCYLLARETRPKYPSKKHKMAYRKLLQRSCRLGSGDGCLALAQLLDTPVISAPEKKLRNTALLRACAKRNAKSCSVLGDMYEQGRGLKHNCPKARAFKRRACSLGARTACLFTCD
ncbi:MAG: sel1 repeat family protein [Myxococcales bacterium]|nr:sel1 repeat family protein [Myxococcales bacterium]MCB9642678.1 sel1 repeat family protein [Myxococcales bacterium]